MAGRKKAVIEIPPIVAEVIPNPEPRQLPIQAFLDEIRKAEKSYLEWDLKLDETFGYILLIRRDGVFIEYRHPDMAFLNRNVFLSMAFISELEQLKRGEL